MILSRSAKHDPDHIAFHQTPQFALALPERHFGVLAIGNIRRNGEQRFHGALGTELRNDACVKIPAAIRQLVAEFQLPGLGCLDDLVAYVIPLRAYIRWPTELPICLADALFQVTGESPGISRFT